MTNDSQKKLYFDIVINPEDDKPTGCWVLVDGDDNIIGSNFIKHDTSEEAIFEASRVFVALLGTKGTTVVIDNLETRELVLNDVYRYQI